MVAQPAMVSTSLRIVVGTPYFTVFAGRVAAFTVKRRVRSPVLGARTPALFIVQSL